MLIKKKYILGFFFSVFSSRIKLPSAMLTTLSQFCTGTEQKHRGNLPGDLEGEWGFRSEMATTDLVDLAVWHANDPPSSAGSMLRKQLFGFKVCIIFASSAKIDFPPVDDCHPIFRMVWFWNNPPCRQDWQVRNLWRGSRKVPMLMFTSLNLKMWRISPCFLIERWACFHFIFVI